MYSPSAPLNSLPAYLEYNTLLPGVIDRGVLLPSSPKGPGPTAMTVPTEGFSLVACVNSKPPEVSSSASATLMRIRSLSGFRSFTSSVSRIPMMSSSFKMRWLESLNSNSVPAYLEYTTWTPTGTLISTVLLPMLLPSPTATTSPPCGFGLTDVGSNIPPGVFSSEILVFTSTLSPNGLTEVYLGDTTVAALTTRPRNFRLLDTACEDNCGIRRPSTEAGFATGANATCGPHRCTDAMAPALRFR